MKLKVNRDLLIDRHYRGAILFLNSKCYTVEERVIIIIESVLHNEANFKSISDEIDPLLEESILQHVA